MLIDLYRAGRLAPIPGVLGGQIIHSERNFGSFGVNIAIFEWLAQSGCVMWTTHNIKWAYFRHLGVNIYLFLKDSHLYRVWIIYDLSWSGKSSNLSLFDPYYYSFHEDLESLLNLSMTWNVIQKLFNNSETIDELYVINFGLETK